MDNLDSFENSTIDLKSDNSTVENIENQALSANILLYSFLEIYLFFKDSFCPQSFCSNESWWTRSRIFVIILSIAALIYLVIVAFALFLLKKRKEEKVEELLQNKTRNLYADPRTEFQDDFFRC